MNTATITKNTNQDIIQFSEERRQAIAYAKAYLLSEDNQPKYDEVYKNKYKQLGAADFAAYAILRGADWRKGIKDVKTNILPCHTWVGLINAQYGKVVSRDLMEKSDWEQMVKQAFVDFPEK